MQRIVSILFLMTIVLHAQTEYSVSSYLEGAIITDISLDGDYVWVSTDGQGIYRYSPDTETWKNYSTNRNNLKHNFFYCIESSSKYIWAGSSDGLFILDKRRNRWSKRKFGKGGQLGNWIRSLEYDIHQNVLWIGRFKNLTKFDLRKRRFTDYDLTIGKDEKTNTFKMIKVDGDSLVWFGTESGIFKYNKNKKLEEPTSKLFYNNSQNFFNRDGKSISVSAMIFEQGNIWFGLDEFLTIDNPDYNIGGIYSFDRKNEWERIDKSNGLDANGIYAMEITGKYIWASLYKFDKDKKEPYGQGIVLINRISRKAEMLKDERIPSDIYTILFDGKKVWLGSKNGVYTIDLTTKFAPSFLKR